MKSVQCYRNINLSIYVVIKRIYEMTTIAQLF